MGAHNGNASIHCRDRWTIPYIAILGHIIDGLKDRMVTPRRVGVLQVGEAPGCRSCHRTCSVASKGNQLPGVHASCTMYEVPHPSALAACLLLCRPRAMRVGREGGWLEVTTGRFCLHSQKQEQCNQGFLIRKGDAWEEFVHAIIFLTERKV